MSWANASYIKGILEHIDGDVRYGLQALRWLEPVDLCHEARSALRRYSTSEYVGQEDGSTLNKSLIQQDGKHSDWADGMDKACSFSFRKDILLWRGGRIHTDGSPTLPFVSTSIVERRARRFRNNKTSQLNAIILPAGSRVAVPLSVWDSGDNERTLGIVKMESEIILPSGTVFHDAKTVEGFPDRPGYAPIVLSVAQCPEMHHDHGMRI